MVTIEESATNRTETVEAKALKWAIEIGGRCIKYIVSEREREGRRMSKVWDPDNPITESY